MCNYQLGTIECRGDGYLWDADCDGYAPNEADHPCPSCNVQTFLQRSKEDAETTSEWSTMTAHGTGADIWRCAVATAEREAPDDAAAALRKIGTVLALAGEDGVVPFCYSQAGA
ncbi:MAG: hypothetical protein VR70_14520 [Rhodospirillaceae bacterium BRH_c57]|nr:MAG: hypothetical protein VR70_15395 [Rhodospirillaceae bacterium BRH_c57]KJS36094.1 MAG: hypothetical protein VR70_14520 [Rhodospirillaceae bacterium BRH_c57]